MSATPLWDQWLALQPLAASLWALLLLGIGALIGWSARRSKERATVRAREPAAVSTPVLIQEGTTRSNNVEAAKDRAYREGEQMAPHEWDSGRPRLNPNQQFKLGDGWRRT